MDDFPEFMKHPANRIAKTNQATPGVDDYDEYMIVVQGCYALIIEGERIFVKAGEERLIPRGVLHSGEVSAGTRTIHAFGGHRADRMVRR